MESHKIIKKIFSCILCLALSFVLAFSCFAQESQTVLAQYTEELGNGITAIVTITESQSFARSTKTHTVKKQYYSSGEYAGTVALMAHFSYNGSTSSAASASGSGIGANGWTYASQKTWTSGSSAYLTATLSKNGTYIPVTLSLTCDANGNVS